MRLCVYGCVLLSRSIQTVSLGFPYAAKPMSNYLPLFKLIFWNINIIAFSLRFTSRFFIVSWIFVCCAVSGFLCRIYTRVHCRVDTILEIDQSLFSLFSLNKKSIGVVYNPCIVIKISKFISSPLQNDALKSITIETSQEFILSLNVRLSILVFRSFFTLLRYALLSFLFIFFEHIYFHNAFFYYRLVSFLVELFVHLFLIWPLVYVHFFLGIVEGSDRFPNRLLFCLAVCTWSSVSMRVLTFPYDFMNL